MDITNIDTNRQKFIDEFSVLVNSGVSVVAIPTKEPYQASQTIKEYCVSNGHDFYGWDQVSGFRFHNDEHIKNGVDPDPEPGTANPVSAIDFISKQEVTKTVSNNAKRAVFTMFWPHWAFKFDSAFIQVVANQIHFLSQTVKRLVLIVPQGFTFPPELTDGITRLDFDLPNREELELITKSTLETSKKADKYPTFMDNESNLDLILNSIAGMTRLEAENAVARAVVKFRSELPDLDINKFVKTLQEIKSEIIKRSEILEIMPKGTMDDIGGLDNLKEWISKRSACFSDDAREFGVDSPSGVALIGPPGTGKSASAKAIANSLGLNLIRFDVSRVFNSLVGSSEARVRECLKTIDALSPCVVLVDEVDKAFDMSSGGGDSGVGMRVLGSILTHMQESKEDIFWVMTANRAKGLPPEMLRKGRLDEIFSVTVPNPTERLDILKIHLRKRKQDPEVVENLDEAVIKSDGYVAAELEAAVKEAVVEAYTNNEEVTGDLIAKQLQSMKPLAEAFSESFEEMQSWAEKNARPASKFEAPNPRAKRKSRSRTAGRNLSLSDSKIKKGSSSLDD